MHLGHLLLQLQIGRARHSLPRRLTLSALIRALRLSESRFGFALRAAPGGAARCNGSHCGVLHCGAPDSACVGVHCVGLRCGALRRVATCCNVLPASRAGGTPGGRRRKRSLAPPTRRRTRPCSPAQPSA
jgi:hypothetical protein